LGTAVTIAVDAMGGDHAPRAVLSGVCDALDVWSDIELMLVGPEQQLRLELLKLGAGSQSPRLSFLHASERIGMEDSPIKALRENPDASINVAAAALRDKRVEALFSAGPTGATVAAVCLASKLLPGIRRPGIAVTMPSLQGPVVLCDVGANVSCRPQHFLHYAIMAAEYCKFIHGIKKPRVGLLNIGEEEGKGTVLVRESYALLRRCSILNFTGFIEGHGIMAGHADIVICDGFTGNTVLKVTEGVGELLLERFLAAVDEVASSLKPQLVSKLAGLSDYSSYGGAPLLGVDGCAIIGHGRSDRKAIKNGIGVARDFARRRINNHIVEMLKAAADMG
jgi:phosphate acyltransferase